jgi:hypothetical protein
MPRTSRALLSIVSCVTLLSVNSAKVSAQNTDTAKPQEAAPVDVSAQRDSERVANIIKLRDKIEEQSKTFHFGLSLGWRHIIESTGSVYRDVVIDPVTNQVEVDPIDNGDFVLSGIVTAFPFGQGARIGTLSMQDLGFLANVNIASFSSDNIATFNKSIEGGFGLAWRLAKDFSLGVTIERMFSRSLRDFVKPNSMLIVGADTIKSLGKDDDRFFRNDNLTAFSVKFLYFLK